MNTQTLCFPAYDCGEHGGVWVFGPMLIRHGAGVVALRYRDGTYDVFWCYKDSCHSVIARDPEFVAALADLVEMPKVSVGNYLRIEFLNKQKGPGQIRLGINEKDDHELRWKNE